MIADLVPAPRGLSAMPEFMLARANHVLAFDSHHMLAGHPSWQVRLAWAVRGDLPADLLRVALDREDDPRVLLALRAAPSAGTMSASDDPWELAAVAASVDSDDRDALMAARQLLFWSSLDRPWESVLAVLAPAVAERAVYPLLLAVALRSGHPAAAVAGAHADDRAMLAILANMDHDSSDWLHVCALACTPENRALGAEAARKGGSVWARSAAVVLADPVDAWQRLERDEGLPLVLSLRVACASADPATLTELIALASVPGKARSLLGVPLLRNGLLDSQSYEALMDLGQGVLPPTAPVRGPWSHAPQVPAGVVDLSVPVFSGLRSFDVGQVLEPLVCDGPAWQVASALWPEWGGSVRELMAASRALA